MNNSNNTTAINRPKPNRQHQKDEVKKIKPRPKNDIKHDVNVREVKAMGIHTGEYCKLTIECTRTQNKVYFCLFIMNVRDCMCVCVYVCSEECDIV